MELTKEEFLVHIGYLRDDLAAVKHHLAQLNGRTRDSENDIADLKTSVAVLDERAGKGTAAMWGGGIAGAVVGTVEAVKALLR